MVAEEKSYKQANAHQPIDMQIDRLTKILDDLYNAADSNLGKDNPVTKRAFKSVLYLHALKCDFKAEKDKQNA